jgi:hypothetical protein
VAIKKTPGYFSLPRSEIIRQLATVFSPNRVVEFELKFFVA